MRCWVLTEGHVGMENQALGLAEALRLAPEVKRLRPRFPWSRLPPRLWLAPLSAPGPGGDRLQPPWPDLLITCGKRSVAPSIAIRRASGGGTFTVHIQDPPLHPRNFDLVVVPAHDAVRGDNVCVTQAAIHRVTPEKLAQAAGRFGARLAHLPHPLVAVLIGGSNRRHRLLPVDAERIGRTLAEMSRRHGAGLMVTVSRRTGAENTEALRRGLGDGPAEIWDGGGENPYFAYLALADALVVTCDSVSMVSEAVSTGKPVYVIELAGRSRRIDAFHRNLRRAGMTRAFTGALEHWDYPPPDDTGRAADEVRRRLAARGVAGATRKACGGAGKSAIS